MKCYFLLSAAAGVEKAFGGQKQRGTENDAK